ncbi:YfcL family protein [Glaciecola sp. 2405UD65-10]|uniref:YfcL family protein n=1 Tax=Glaciecola sp. 2405UD65-10 TaxID=3397244 RepID=UPI003B59308C
MSYSNIEQYLVSKESFLDAFIDTGTEHDLFVSSYIHGHFSVQAAQLAVDETQSTVSLIESFEQSLQASIFGAIENNELSPSDAQDVRVMLKALFKK